MSEQSLLGSGVSRVLRNKRYIVWFYLLSLLFGAFGTIGFVNQAGAVLDHSLESDRLVHGLHLSTLIEMFSRPEFGPSITSRASAMFFALVFLLATAFLLPGVFQGYASTYRLPRGEFFRACGQNLWRFIRLMIVAGIVMGIVAGALFGANGAIVKKAGDSTNEMLPFVLQMLGLFVIFLVMTVLRIWFDLAEADTVLNDQSAVRKSIAAGFRHTFRSLGRLLGSYLVTTLVAAIVLVGGLWCWMRFVPPASVFGAWIIAQLTLLLLLIPRFWQRGIAVSYWQRSMLIPVAVVEPTIALPAVQPVVVVPAATEPVPSEIPNLPPTPQES